MNCELNSHTSGFGKKKEPIPDSAFVICAEKGLLEYKALCLILSLRRNGGRWSKLPIYAYSPREGHRVSPWLKDIYREFNIIAVEENINKNYVDYPLANKPLAMSHAERELSEETIIFLDSDILVWREPEDFLLPAQKTVGIVIDADKSVASSGPDDEFDGMWRELYELAGVNETHYVKTILTRENVKSWWCSGVIASRRNEGIMNRWMVVFERALRNCHFHPRAAYLREQITFSATAAGIFDKVACLSPKYNYHVQGYLRYKQNFGISPEEAVLWHYQPYFDRAFRKFKEELDSIESVEQKVEKADEFIGVLYSRYYSMIGLDEPWHKTLRRKMRLGVRIRKALGIEKGSDRYC